MNTTAETPTPTGVPSGEVRLRRSVNGSIGGVAGGLAHFFGVEAKWFRIAFLVSLIFGGVGFLAYIALWLGLPDEHDPRTARFATTQNVTRLVVALIFAVFAVGAMTGGAAITGSLAVPALLVAGGVYLLSQREDVDIPLGGQSPKAPSPPAATGTVPPPPRSYVENPPAPADDRDPLLVEAERLMSGEMHGDPVGPDAFANDPSHWAMTRGEQVAQPTKRKRPPISTFALGSAALVSALLVLVSQGGIPFFVYPFVFLGFSVLGFFASLLFRRPAWTLGAVAFLSFWLGMGGIFAAGTFDDGVGEFTVQIDGLEAPLFDGEIVGRQIPLVPEIPDDFHHGVGEFNLDLDDLELEEDRAISAGLEVGQMNIDLPDDLRTRIVLAEGVQVSFDDGTSRSFSDGDVLLINGSLDAGPELTINADIALGEITLDIDSDEYELSR